MTVATLAEAALLVKADLSQVTNGVAAAGQKAGVSYGEGFTKGADGKIRDQNGRFVSSSAKAGTQAGEGYGTGFKRGADGKLRDAQGKFVNDSTISGGKAGAGYGNAFGKKSKSSILSSLKDTGKMAAGFLVPAGIAGAVGEIAKIGMQYEDNLNIFQSVSKATGAQMDAVAAKARALGADVKLPGVSAAGAAEAMTELAKAGLNVSQSMDAAKGTLELARAASIDEAKAAEITGNAINTFGLKAKDTTFVVDELAAAANSSSVEVGDVSDAFKMAGAVFSSFQGPAVGSKEAITELNTAIAVLGNNGIKGSDAGTSLKQMLLQLTGPSQQAKAQMALLNDAAEGANISLSQQNDVLHGSKKVRDAAIASIDKHNKSMKLGGDIAFDSAGKMRPLNEIIARVTAGTKNLSDEDRDYAITQIFGADAARSVIALMKGGIPVYEKQRQAVLQVGAASDVAAAKNKGLGGAIDNVRSQLENAAIGIYTAVKGPLTKSLNDMASELSTTFGFIGKHSGAFVDLAKAAALAATAYATYTLAVKANSAATIVWAAIQGGIAWVQLLGAVRSFRDLWAAITLIMDANPLGLVVVGLAALTAGVIYAYKHWGWFKTAVDAVWKALQIAFKATVDFIVNKAWPALVTAWHGIADAGKWAWDNVLKPVLGALVTAWHGVAAAGLWLWHTVLEPVWKGISWAINSAAAVIQLHIAIIIAVFKPLGATAMWLWHDAIVPAFKGIWSAIKFYIAFVKVELNALVWLFNHTLGPVFTWLWQHAVKPAFDGIRSAISAAWNFIRPILIKLGDFVSKSLVTDFKNGVSAIKAAWNVLKAVAQAPVKFVVNQVINPLIGGFNKIAGVFGTKQIAKIPGFAEGGRIPGSPSSVDNRMATMVGPGGKQLGPLKVATGEFIVNASDTARALPLLQWINNGMKGGASSVAARLGRPMADYPGDGSEGWAFAKGGLVGFLSDVWGAIQDPKKLIKAPLEGALSKIPGSGDIKTWLSGMGHKLIDGLAHFMTSFGGGDGKFAPAGRVGGAQSFLRAQAGKPYVWASAGPGGYDCSGIVSAAYNILHGKSPYSHTFSTESLPGGFFKKGSLSGPLIAGWSHPGQAPASASVGHMAGNLAGMGFESRGSKGVVVGPAARSVRDFANIGSAYSDGGLVRVAKMAQADFGKVTLAPGNNLVYNGTGAPEPLSTEAAGRMHPDDIAALAAAIGGALAVGLRSTIPSARVAGRQAGRPR
jgi:TP901 family phage tail tape measure protein